MPMQQVHTHTQNQKKKKKHGQNDNRQLRNVIETACALCKERLKEALYCKQRHTLATLTCVGALQFVCTTVSKKLKAHIAALKYKSHAC